MGIQDFQMRKDCECTYVCFYNESGDKRVMEKYKSRQKGLERAPEDGDGGVWPVSQVVSKDL